MENTGRKTIIIYGSKKGTTRRCAGLVSERLSSRVEMKECRRNTTWDGMGEYGCIIIGTPLYMGKPLRHVADFCRKNEEKLLEKQIAFFFCGVGNFEEDMVYVRKHIPDPLLQKAVIIRHFGGELLFDRMNLLERLAMKAYVNKRGPVGGIDDSMVEEFCNALNADRK